MYIKYLKSLISKEPENSSIAQKSKVLKLIHQTDQLQTLAYVCELPWILYLFHEILKSDDSAKQIQLGIKSY
jgi:hypothetical protein